MLALTGTNPEAQSPTVMPPSCTARSLLTLNLDRLLSEANGALTV